MKLLLSSFLVLLTSVAAFAQEAPQFPEPTEHHKWLEKFTGEWESTAKGMAAEGQPEMTMKGTMSSQMLGGFWVVNNIKANTAGVEFTGIQTIGYDVEKKKYIGTWIDSMMNFMWLYEGSVSEDGTTLTLEAEGPNMMEPGKSAKYRDIYQFKTKDHVIAKSQVQDEDGSWVTFMQGESKRKAD